MFDCGVHPGLTGMASLPFFDEVDLATVDAILITHFHLDHCAALPYVVGRTPFKGRVLMTHATKAVVATLLRDFVRVSKTGPVAPLYGDADLDAALAATDVVDFHQTIELAPGVTVTPRRAGHVLGRRCLTHASKACASSTPATTPASPTATCRPPTRRPCRRTC